ncbi:adenosylcobinamide-GDP ribazoletransferase [Inmirania thermothiophila]|uniref:Adenosylcobinamide-GDP ribazoletransferase n=1 Tax=Inmirania thermothiophila TaxID=1750597 RepID=A0A3N1XZN7_9GAMM|nr:adenosylcobinamide-GDP ribazoletransferase [Inmirania thermothiophila]ROR32056.1 cobalamin-5'-phosphate synthase [Inmirania thermothiophila]
MLRPLRIALGLLTRWPVPAVPRPTGPEHGASLAWYGVAGVAVGAPVALVAWGAAASGAGAGLAAAVALAVWVLVTGALHLDGLADTADAWVGGLGDRARTLAILKDPASGPAGVTAIVLVLLLAHQGLAALVAQGRWVVPPVAAVAARALAAVLLAWTPYVRPGGMAEAAVRHAPRRACLAGAGVALGASVALGGVPALAAWAGAGGAVLGVRGWALRRLGGLTGDVVGAAIQLAEAAALVAAVAGA